MTLFIACLLINRFNMDWWWYLVAVALYGGHDLVERMRMKEFRDSLYRLERGIAPPGTRSSD